MADKPGTLYLCATPIGNLEDITLRAVRVLKEAAAVAAEDTRHTRKLLSHFEIHTPLISYHEHNKAERGPDLVGRLLAGEDIALVSDAGLPGISDPGAELVQLAVAAGITVSPVPGANAALSALVCSGLDTRMFIFVGFLPKTSKKRKELLSKLVDEPYTMLFYESPYRVRETVAELLTALGNRRAAVGRELTKRFEEFVRGGLEDIARHFAVNQPRGEFTLVVAGAEERAAAAGLSGDPAQVVYEMMAEGIAKKEAIRLAAGKLGLSKRVVYQAVLDSEARQGK